MQYLIAFCCRPEAAGDVISGRCVMPIVPNKYVKFDDPHQKPSEAAFLAVFFRNNFQMEVVSDVTSSGAVDKAGTDVPVKVGDFRSNRS